MMYDLNKYKEFNKEEYDEIKKIVYKELKTGKKMECLYDFNYVKKGYDELLDKYESIWSDFVDYVDLVQKGEISNAGTIITEKIKGHCEVPENEYSAWQIFKERLINQNKYTFEELEGLEKSANKILNSISQDTSKTGPIKGLVMGYVQSGKTNSIESIITMSADYGYNVFIVLSGIMENLRKQTLDRMRFDIDFGKNGNIHWEFIDQVTKETPKAYDLINSNKKVVVVTLKNSKRLTNLRKWLFNSSESSLVNAKILFIDDEADQAGLNTRDVNKPDEERSKINGLITDLIDNYVDKVGGMNYIGYTATPYGNFLNEEKSIYPKDFIYMLPKSLKYIGALEIFGSERLSGRKVDGLDIVRNIKNKDLKELSLIEEDKISRLPDSLIDALCWFICTFATFRYNNKISPVTMLIHDNRKTNNHFLLSNSISKYLNEVDIDEFISRCSSIYQSEINRFTKQDFYDVMVDYGREIPSYVPFEKLEPIIRDIMSYKITYAKNINDEIIYSKGIHSVIDNSSIKKILNEEEQPRLIYPDRNSDINYSTGFIVVGGDTLSRGLTLEGLTTTYFARKSDTVDTLMQMGRWFGYRIGYELLPRIWLDKTTLLKYNELTNVELELRNDLSKYEIGTSPAKCGPVILTTYYTRTTAKSKMQSAVVNNYDYRGADPQTILFDKNVEVQKYNVNLTDNFISNFEFKKAYNSSSNLFVEKVDFKYIKDYLEKFKFCSKSTFFNNINSFCEWIYNCEYDSLKKWNIILAGIGKIDLKGQVSKVYRTKLIDYDDRDYINIKILRNTKDIISDVNPNDYYIDMTDEKDIIEFRNSIDIPQLIIYRIDGRKSPDNIKKNRTPINMDCDIIGLYLYVPGVMKKNYYHSIHMNLNQGDEI